MEKTQSAAEEKKITAPEEPPAEEKTELAIEPATEKVAAEETAEEIAPETTAAEEIAAAAAEQIAEDAPSVGLEESAQEQPAEEFKPKSGFRYGCYLFVKRSFDIFASGLFLIVFCWLYLILAICVKCSDGGSVIYRHKRIGKNRKPIHISKFRSMKKNADQLENMLTPEQLEQYRREYKIDNDPRITKIGNFLRKTSLDELPQVWDIFVGRISVVGPRPLMEREVNEKYGVDGDKLLSVKPGMIGWWGCNGRSNTTYESGERQKLELYYVDHCSVWFDIKIIFKTIGSVFKRTGAQ